MTEDKPKYGERVEPDEEVVIDFQEFHSTPMKPLTKKEQKAITQLNKKPINPTTMLLQLTLLSTVPVFYIIGMIEVIGNLFK